MNIRFIESASVISLLRNLGLTKYEMLVYLTLLKDGPRNYKALTRLTGIPTGKIYTVVKALAKKGWVITSYDKRPKNFYAVDPEIAINKRIAELKDKLNLLERNAKVILYTLKPIFDRITFSTDSSPTLARWKNEPIKKARETKL